MAGNPFVVPGAAVQVTSATAGLQILPPTQPGQGGFGWAVVSNVSPWLCTVTGAGLGTITLQPFYANVVPLAGQQTLVVDMSAPPGTAVTVPAGVASYVQTDWYEQGGGPPPGTWPVSLTAQATAAAILETSQTQFVAVADSTVVSGTPGVYPLNGFVYPAGLGPANFHCAAVAVSGTAGNLVTCFLADPDGMVLWSQLGVPLPLSGLFTFAVPLTGGGPGSAIHVVLNSAASSLTLDIILDQVPDTPAVLVAGSQTGASVAAAGSNYAGIYPINRVNNVGEQYVVPCPPDTSASDHPPTELGLYLIEAGTPLPAPGAGLRYRLFAIWPLIQAEGDAGYITLNPNTGDGALNYFAFGGATGPYTRDGVVFPLIGLALATNTAVSWTDVTGTNNCTILATLEGV